MSRSFTLAELVASETAERSAVLKAAQESPSEAVVESLRHLCESSLQPVRDLIGYPMHINSGYRSPAVNMAVGSSSSSQHLLGEAADVSLPTPFLTDLRTDTIRKMIRHEAEALTGKPIKPEATSNQNWYLFALVVLNLDKLDIDQVIHEHGRGYGQPAWVHIAASARKNARQILFIGEYVGGKNTLVVTDKKEALLKFT